MFYQPKNGHGLPHNPFNALITPRPIGWISSRSNDGVDNLAPYSFFNAVAYVPPQVMFASTSKKDDQPQSKDSVENIRQTGVFCVNILGHSMIDAMNASSEGFAKEVDEFAKADLEKQQCELINCARVAQSPAALECKMTEIITLKGEHNYLVLGEVIGVHMRDEYIKDGMFDVTAFNPLARLGYRYYSTVTDVFELKRPDEA